jgi:transcriptional antiterminator RfaH
LTCTGGKARDILRSTLERTRGVGVDAWYAVVTKPRAEAQARDHLHRQGYECLLPRVRRVFRGAAGLKSRIEALFPNYLFLRADTERDSLAPVRSTRGAIGLVRFGAEPVRVPDGVIAQIRQRMDGDEGLVRLDAPELTPGAKVRVTDGPLLGWDGVFLAVEGNERVRLLLQLLGSVREVVLPRAQLALRV